MTTTGGDILQRRRVALVGAGLLADSAGAILAAAGAEVGPTDTAEVTVVFDGDDVVDVIRGLDAPAVLVADRAYDAPGLVHALLAGAVAVVPCDDGGEALVDAVANVLDGQAVLSPRLTRQVLERAQRAAREGAVGALVRLTPREHSVLECIARGLSVKQTAARLLIAPKTVENTQSRLYKRLDVRNRAQAVRVAHELGLVG
jgi:DNA-binding NarL/FixJ family response regulator